MQIDKEDERYSKNLLTNLYNVSRETLDKLDAYVFLLLKWNKSINLIAKSTISNIWSRHILDSAQILQYIPQKNVKLVDLGSGGGLPGLVLAILGVQNSFLIESDTRKCAFLLEASRLATEKIEIKCERIEKIKNLECDIVTSRSLINLHGLLNYVAEFNIRSKMIFLKGQSTNEEIIAAQKEYEMEYIKHKSITNEESYIIEINKFNKIVKNH